MDITIRRVINIDAVPTDHSSIIVYAQALKKGLSVKIRYRRIGPRGGHTDRTVHAKCPAQKKTAMQLANDLANLTDCDTVYVFGDIIEHPLC